MRNDFNLVTNVLARIVYRKFQLPIYYDLTLFLSPTISLTGALNATLRLIEHTSACAIFFCPSGAKDLKNAQVQAGTAPIALVPKL